MVSPLVDPDSEYYFSNNLYPVMAANSKGVETSSVQIRKRGTKLEKDIQRELCDYLREQGYLFWRSNNVPVFSASNDGVRRFRALPKDTPRGLPDIIVVRDGQFTGIEVKRMGSKLRPEQAEFGAKLVMEGARYLVIHSLEELKEQI